MKIEWNGMNIEIEKPEDIELLNMLRKEPKEETTTIATEERNVRKAENGKPTAKAENPIDAFKNAMFEGGYSKPAVQAYCNYLRNLSKAAKKKIDDLTEDDLLAFMCKLEDDGISEASIAGRKCAYDVYQKFKNGDMIRSKRAYMQHNKDADR